MLSATKVPRLGQTASARLGVGPGDSGKIDAERLGQRAVGRQLLPAPQAAAGHVSRQGLDDAPVERPLTVIKRRAPIHTFSL
jgi:hypothetical protein